MPVAAGLGVVVVVDAGDGDGVGQIGVVVACAECVVELVGVGAGVELGEGVPQSGMVASGGMVGAGVGGMGCATSTGTMAGPSHRILKSDPGAEYVSRAVPCASVTMSDG